MTARAAYALLSATLFAAFSAAPGAAGEAGKLGAYGKHLAAECTSCHRPDGADATIPWIAGKPQTEFIDLLHAYREGRKTNSVMVSVARSLSEEEMTALAAYFAALPKGPARSPP